MLKIKLAVIMARGFESTPDAIRRQLALEAWTPP